MNLPPRTDEELIRDRKRTLVNMAIVLAVILVAVAVSIVLVLTGQ